MKCDIFVVLCIVSIAIRTATNVRGFCPCLLEIGYALSLVAVIVKNMCSSETSTFTIPLEPQVKTGNLLHYKRRFIGSNWHEVYAVLYQDSSLAWFKDASRYEAEDGLRLRDAPEFIAVGQFTARVPGRPELPANVNFSQLMVFGTRHSRHLYWFMARSDDEVNAWMIAIANTLPAPPVPASAPPMYSEQPTTMPQSQQYGPMPPPSQTFNSRPLQVESNYPLNRGMGYGNVGQVPQTVVVQNRDSGVGDLATGMMLGAALSNISRPSFGFHGFGWGCGGGWGFHPPSGHMGPSFVNHDVNVTNNFNINETVVNNDVELIDQTNNFLPSGVNNFQPETNDFLPESSNFLPDTIEFDGGYDDGGFGGVDPGLLEF